ncbi:hypothetical protein [Haloimpatiens massiliensis]|uniref:hypothetical protein n=1 Tax=Haloimpatiens massiliensis TaxID=1658110 RepID=UPI000C826CD6|nr:hypothetical protein [Haloimpatiens massiliensis]
MFGWNLKDKIMMASFVILFFTVCGGAVGGPLLLGIGCVVLLVFLICSIFKYLQLILNEVKECRKYLESKMKVENTQE